MEQLEYLIGRIVDVIIGIFLIIAAGLGMILLPLAMVFLAALFLGEVIARCCLNVYYLVCGEPMITFYPELCLNLLT